MYGNIKNRREYKLSEHQRITILERMNTYVQHQETAFGSFDDCGDGPQPQRFGVRC